MNRKHAESTVTQPQLLLLQKTMMVTEGVGRMLNPNLNMWQLAQPIIEERARSNFGPAGKLKKRRARQAIWREKFRNMLRQAENALTLLGDAQGLKLHPQTIARLEESREARNRQWPRLGWAALGVVTVAVSGFLLHRRR